MTEKLVVCPLATVDVAGVMAMLVGISAPVLLSTFPPPEPQPESNAIIKIKKFKANLLGEILNRPLIEYIGTSHLEG